MTASADIFHRLMAVVEDRQVHRPPNSYTARLFEGGVEVIGGKVLEEAAEVVNAARRARNDGSHSVAHEAADLVYHLLVLLAASKVSLSDVEAELARRFGASGLEEKASRK